MKTNRKLLLAIAVLILSSQGCSNNAQKEDAVYSMSEMRVPEAEEQEEMLMERDYKSVADEDIAMSKRSVSQAPPAIPKDEIENFIATKAASAENDGDKKFIRTANLTIKVKSIVSATQTIEDLIIARKGFIINSRISNENVYTNEVLVSKDSIQATTLYRPVGSLTLRVHYTLLDETLRAIAPIAEQVKYREVDANDISFNLIAKYIEQNRKKDKAQRIKNVSATAGGQRLNERLSVEDAIDRAREMADNAYLAELQQNDLVKYSTITISLEQDPLSITTMQAVKKEVARYEPNYMQQIGTSIAQGWYAIVKILIVLISLWPLWLVVVAGVFAYKAYRKRKKNKE